MKWIKILHMLISKFLMKNRSPTVTLDVGDPQPRNTVLMMTTESSKIAIQ